jgi:HrpA-like RNA helicase
LAKRLGLANGGYDDFDGIPAVMNKAIDAPHPLALKNAVGLLVEIGAMDDETNALTDLGWKLSGLSVAPRLGNPFVLPRKHQRCGERSEPWRGLC